MSGKVSLFFCVSILSLSRCNSMVGVVGNGEQILNMGPGCEYVGLVLHEFGHAIGYFHEHNRPDRDNVIQVLWDNVQECKFSWIEAHHTTENFQCFFDINTSTTWVLNAKQAFQNVSFIGKNV